jgi:anti-sigma regulatory factor (Ser/Thr protein kinase)
VAADLFGGDLLGFRQRSDRLADLAALRVGCPMADDVILRASELAANAAVHSHSRLPGSAFTVRAKISPGDYAWIEVEDNGGPWTPAVREPNALVQTNRSLLPEPGTPWLAGAWHVTQSTKAKGSP